MMVLIQMGTNMAAGKQQKHLVWDGILYLNQDYVTEFCYKRVNISLEELKSIEIILFLIHELFRWVR